MGHCASKTDVFEERSVWDKRDTINGRVISDVQEGKVGTDGNDRRKLHEPEDDVDGKQDGVRNRTPATATKVDDIGTSKDGRRRDSKTSDQAHVAKTNAYVIATDLLSEKKAEERTSASKQRNSESVDERDADFVNLNEAGSDPVPDLQIIDLDENEEYIQKLQEAYQRKPHVLTRKDLLADVYRMDFPRRGTAVVINNENFKKSSQRKGTFVDFSRICSRLEKLCFQVERYNDLTCSQMMHVLDNAAKTDHSEADCFACVLLSHGGSNEIHGTDGEMKLETIFNLFRSSMCPTLAGKPKLFFIQSCRGEEFDDGSEINYAKMNVTDAETGFGVPEEEVQISIPEEADFLIAYSTTDGYYSWRNSQKGSWYIQALVHVLDKCGTVAEIRKILTKVNKMVAFEFQSTDRRHFRKKQIPSFNSKLTKDLYFSPK